MQHKIPNPLLKNNPSIPSITNQVEPPPRKLRDRESLITTGAKLVFEDRCQYLKNSFLGVQMLI
jgi:hypothetical protein